jgi:hypothetical protein
MKAYGYIGLVFLLIGTMMIAGIWAPVSGATIIYTGPVILPSPSGTLATPTAIPANTNIPLLATITDSKSTVSSATVQVKDYTAGGTTVATLSMVKTANPDVWGAQWLCPDKADNIYAFVFTALNAAGGSATVTTYGKVAVATPTGAFFINDIAATTTTTIAVSNPVLQIKFTAYSAGYRITSVTCKLLSGGVPLQSITLTETTTDITWTGIITLPAPGTYTLNGYFSDGTTTWQEMSVVMESAGTGFTISQMFGMVLDALGVLFLAIDRKLLKLW